MFFIECIHACVYVCVWWGGGGGGDMTNISLIIMVLLFVSQGAGCAGGLTEMA